LEHLSSLDASFLHLETPETPMHVGSLMLLELPEKYGGDFYDELKAMLGRRLHLSRALTRKLAPMPFDLAEPVWIDDDDIDLDYHVRSLTSRKPGTMAQVEQMVARLHSSLLDRSRPLWEMYVIEGLQDGRIAFYTKVHHSGVDGKAGAELAKVLYDTSADIREVPPAPRRRENRPYQLGVTELLQAAVANSTAQYRKLGDLLPTAGKALTATARAMARNYRPDGGRPLPLGAAPRTIFNGSITNQRTFASLSLSMDEVKALGKRVGGTVNTIVMAMCSGAVRGFLADRAQLPKESMIALVPVSLRAADDDSMNNQVTMIRVDLATDIKDLSERFKAIHASSEAGKAVVRELKPVLGFDVPVLGAPWLMSGMASFIGRSGIAGQLPPSGNVVISNVPGPPAKLYVAGAEMLHYFPVSIPYHGNALNITVQSYAGRLEIGLTACRRTVSAEEARELIDRTLAALREIETLGPAAEAAPSGPAKSRPARTRTRPAA
jgi:WS/DGAT/MGAT family acyltransferase